MNSGNAMNAEGVKEWKGEMELKRYMKAFDFGVKLKEGVGWC